MMHYKQKKSTPMHEVSIYNTHGYQYKLNCTAVPGMWKVIPSHPKQRNLHHLHLLSMVNKSVRSNKHRL